MNIFIYIFPVDLLRVAEPGVSHRLQPRGELRGDAEKLLVLLPQSVVVVQQTGVLVPAQHKLLLNLLSLSSLENVELCWRL